MTIADGMMLAWVAGIWHIGVFWAGYIAGGMERKP